MNLFVDQLLRLALTFVVACVPVWVVARLRTGGGIAGFGVTTSPLEITLGLSLFIRWVLKNNVNHVIDEDCRGQRQLFSKGIELRTGDLQERERLHKDRIYQLDRHVTATNSLVRLLLMCGIVAVIGYIISGLEATAEA